MVKSTSKRKVEVKLVLDEPEALYLRSLLQNYLGTPPEHPTEAKFRRDLFNTLSKELNLETKGPPKRPKF